MSSDDYHLGDDEFTHSIRKYGGLVFACLTIPFLWSLTERRQDCYRTRAECEQHWGVDCDTHPEPNCPYVGRSYSTWFGRGRSGPAVVGHVSRGGFGATGRGFSSGS